MKYVTWLHALVLACAVASMDAIANTAPDAKPSTSAAEFPHRTSFPDVPIISTADLANRGDGALAVDVRTRYEYETLRIKEATNLPVTDKQFVDKVKALRTQHATKALVFYCNGKTCKKSYDAARMAIHAGVENVFCFDAGIQEWAQTYPDRTTLLGRSPIKTSELITGEQFKGHILAATDFEGRIGTQALVLDIRDTIQRDIALFPYREERVPLDQKERLDAVIERAKAQNKTLLVYDKAGHQIQWFQYYLEHKGLKQYYFMKGGAEGYFEATLGVRMGLNK